VKVGDWVSVGGVEGDVRRIRVRATEIQTFDRSTVIVPNANLITNPVENKTLGEPRGRIRLQIGVARDADPVKAKAAILEAIKAEPRALSDPAPAVYIDGMGAAGTINFMCHVYVASPRDSYKVRSDLYFDVLTRFRDAGVSLATA
jgi:small-conductance mechanosensitive channel